MLQRSVFARACAVGGVAAAALAVVVAAPASAEPTWLPVTDLSDGTPLDFAPEVAVGTNGTAVAVWGRASGANFTVMAARKSPTGEWGTAVPISSTHSEAQLPHAVVDSVGNASVIWSAGDGTGSIRAAHRAASAGSWSAPATLAAAGGEADIAVDTNGIVLAAWSNAGKISVARKSATGSWTAAAAISGTGTANHPRVAFDGAGNATAVWHSFDGVDYDVKAARRPSGQAWQAATFIANSADNETDPILTVDHGGNAVAAWKHSLDGSARVEAAYRKGAAAAWSAVAWVSPSGESASPADIDIDESGNVAAVWNASLEGGWAAKAATLLGDGTWSSAATLSDANSSTRANNVALDKAGNVAVSLEKETDTEDVAQVALKPAGGAWAAAEPLSAQDDVATGTHVGYDTQGNLTGVWYTGPGSDTTVQTTTLDAAGPSTSMTQPASSRQTATSFTAAWSAADRWSDVETKDVRFRQAPWNGDFGTQTDWKTDTTDNSGVVAGVAGTSYCFSARATDAVGNEGAWSAERCTATPVDDRTLTRTSAWTRGTSTSYYLGTYTSTKTNAAKLTRTGLQVKHLSLLVTTCASCGKVKVVFNGTNLGTFDLASSSTVRKKIITVKSFTSVQTGTLTLQHVSPTGKTVYIDGVIARRF